MMDEECIMPKATDQTFLTKLISAHNGKHPKFMKPSAKSKLFCFEFRESRIVIARGFSLTLKLFKIL